MTAAGRKRASGAVSDQPKSKKRVKVGNAEKGSKNGKQMLPPSERFVDQTAHKTSTRNHQNSLPAETDCSECFTVPNCSVACNVSCDGSDDCTAPEPCNDPSCEGDPCWEDDCENYDCTDQSCKANQCRIELCSQETCFEDINSLNHELYANISDPCWGLCQNPDQLLCLQDCVIDNPDASKPNAALGQEQTYSSCPTQNWNGYPFSHPDLLAYENSQNPSLQLRLPSASHTNQNQNINLPNHGTAPEMLYPSYDLNDLIAVTSASNLYSASLDSNPHSYIRDVRSQAVDNSARVSGTEFRSCWPTEKDFETLARASASTSNRLSVSTTVSSPLDMIAAAAELSAGMELPYPYMQQHSEGQAEQAYLEAAPENSDKPNAPSLTAEKTLSGNGNICFCKWKTKKDGELGKFGLCNRQFDTEEGLWIHVKSDHTSALINKYTCQWHGCARPGHFGTKSKLERHLLPHTGYKEHKCPICSAAFSLKQQVENHIRIHTGDTPFKCDECGQTFRTAQARDDHKRRHRGVRQFKCRICGLACTDASNRSKHERTHRLEAYECRQEGCKAKAKRWDNIKRHFEHMGHCLELIHDPKEQRRYKKEAEAATRGEDLQEP